MEERFEATKDRIKWLLDLEVRPFTLNKHYLADYREKFYSYYKGCREQDLNQELSSSLLSLDIERKTKRFAGLSESAATVNEALASLVKLGLTGLKPSDLLRLIPADEMEPALGIMADIRAYFQGITFGFPQLFLSNSDVSSYHSCIQEICRQHSPSNRS